VRLAGEQPEAILLDFMMSVLSGCQMLHAMALEPAYQRIPVIIMSSLSERAVAERCRGYAGFLHNPFRVAAVMSTVDRIFDAEATDAAR
jgi:CheY-like chemotaxis protein